MATIEEEPINKIVEQVVKDAEDDDVGIMRSWANLVRKIGLGGIIKGFMTGVGVFIGSLFCHYYILPYLDLQDYSLFLIKLHKV
mmetsp:Transcript_23748/g.26372  ORF Transcript_23748/g.26372 Transcript_23748/m.26372 type:complete len:84 (-) Transcript_23748:36-287(-)